jgi:hypothetical protein
LQPVQTLVPEPAVCLQEPAVVMLTQVCWHELAALQFCRTLPAPVAVLWQGPEPQFMVQVLPLPQLSWQFWPVAQLTTQVEPVQLAWHSPVAGQAKVQLPEVQLHCWPPMQLMLLPEPPPEPPSLPLGLPQPKANANKPTETTERRDMETLLEKDG